MPSDDLPVYDPDLHPSLRAWAPTQDRPFDAVLAGHLMNRAAFGGLPAEVEALAGMGVAGAVDALLDFPDAPASELSRGDVPDDTMLEGVPMSDAQRRQAMLELDRAQGPEEARTARQLQQQRWRAASQNHMRECGRWWLARMADGPYPLQEKLTLFWHGHFTSSYRDDREGSWRLWNQNELLRTHAAGDFRTFVRQVSRDPAMLKYLNNDQNVNVAPNENYARELMELFTLGVSTPETPNYSEDDIKQAARAFTGWTHDGLDFTFRQRLHDEGEKRIFGQIGSFGGDDVVELLMRHPATGPYVGGKLYEFFVGATPAADVRASLGRILTNANYELRPLIRTILRSEAFFAPERVGGKIKSPVQLVAGTCRLLGVAVPPQRETMNELEKMAQVPFAPPNVKGWPGQYDGRRWINTATLLARYNFCVEVAAEADVPAAASAGEFVEAWLSRLIPRPVPLSKKRRLAAVAGSRPTASSLADTLKMIVSMPEYQLC